MEFMDKYNLFIVGENGESITIKRRKAFQIQEAKIRRKKTAGNFIKTKENPAEV